MPKITALQPHPRKGLYHLFVDGLAEFDVSEQVVVSERLRVGQEVDRDRLESIVTAEQGYQALQKALVYLEPRMRSAREIVTRLRRGQFGDDAIEYALGRLRTMGLIDDAQFAARWVSARSRTEGGRPIGRRRLKSELMVKGVAPEHIDEALGAVSDDDELSLAFAAARKKVRSAPTDPEEQLAERRRLAAFLQRRGFGWDVVKKVMNEVLGAADDE